MSKSRFVWEKNDVEISQCATCEHKSLTGATCSAFPGGIPDVILTNEFDHTEAYPGDNGIQYEKRKKGAT